MAEKVKDKMTPDGERFFREVEKLKKLMLRVGYQQGVAQEEDGTDLCDVAMFNELGTARTPSRPFWAMSVTTPVWTSTAASVTLWWQQTGAQ